jgi:hypothetical protein
VGPIVPFRSCRVVKSVMSPGYECIACYGAYLERIEACMQSLAQSLALKISVKADESHKAPEGGGREKEIHMLIMGALTF